MNFSPVRGPWGGGNQLLGALRAELERRGHEIRIDSREQFDITLLNALMQDIEVEFVRDTASRTPFVHHKVGYRVSGLPPLRARFGRVRGTVHRHPQRRRSDALQRTALVTPPGPRIAAPPVLGRERAAARHRLELVDRSEQGLRRAGAHRPARDGRNGVVLELVGRKPPGLELQTVRHLRARRPPRLAEALKRRHVLLQLARHETSSNALIEGINCGLPLVYLDSGSNAELAAPYGVEYRGDLDEALGRIRSVYSEIVSRIEDNPHRMPLVAGRYKEVLERAAGSE